MIVHSEVVLTSGAHNGPRGYLVRPADEVLHPGIVLIQEWWGIEPHVLDLAQKLAAQGFIVLVPDLYHGQVATEPDDARKLVMLVRENTDRALSEVELALEYLRHHAQAQPKKLGLMGFCMGGMLTFKTASRYPHLGAISPWYGGGYDPTTEDLTKINAPILAVYGELDGGIPPAQIELIEKTIRAAGKDITVKVYAGAGHAFLNNTHGSYNAVAAKDAWQMALDFFKRYLV